MTSDALSDKKQMWRVRLFGGPILVDRFGNETRHFRSQKVRAMLAYLALHLGSPCPREVLYEALWPEEEHEVVANRFRVALASLRRQLEPDPTPFGTILDVSEPRMVRLRSETVSCDVSDFETLWRSGRKEEALRLTQQPLLPDNYEEWAINVRTHYEMLAQSLPLANSSHSNQFLSNQSLSTPSLLNQSLSGENTSELTISPSMRQSSDFPSTAHFDPDIRSLPLYLTRFFGREEEQRKLLAMLGDNRLVTITGLGGLGKTRLAAETARQANKNCLFVSIGLLTDASQLPGALLKSLGMACNSEMHSEALEDYICRQLTERGEILLILDSAEHLINDVASLTMRFLMKVPTLYLLVTSRQILNIPGEMILPLTPLAAPASSDSLELLLTYPSVSLFMDRAVHVRPDFALTMRNMEAIAEICQRLEGIPLALELAAARITAQTPGQLAHALRQNFTDLKARQRGLSERHRSLRTVIDTSLILLPEEVRTFFFALAVFQDGWTVETAKTVTGCAQSEEFLETLAAASLVECREDEQLGVMRYFFLKTVRQLALQNDSDEALAEWDTKENLIVNGSFEEDRPRGEWLSASGGLFPYPFITAFGWQGIGSVNVNMPNFAAFSRGIPHGSNTAVVGDQTRSGRLFQDVAAALIAGTTYTLSAWIGNRTHYNGAGRITLETLSGHLLAESGVVRPAEGTFDKVTISFTAQTDTEGLGEQLRVILDKVEGVQANFDCVSLTASPHNTA